MFDRKTYKTVAKKQLAKRYGAPIAATAVSAVLLIALLVPDLVNDVSPLDMSWGIILSLLTVFIVGTLNMASKNLYLEMFRTKDKVGFSAFIRGFGNWMNGFLSILLFAFWTTLWTLLLIVPGIVKAISYSQMFFILAEYPDLSATKALRLSKAMTQGHKADLFIMELSFLLWDILCVLSCGIGFLWLIPYKSMSSMNAYQALKAQALRQGLLTERDFTTN